jgi:uncharacterized protein YggE
MTNILVCKIEVDYRSETSLRAKINEVDAIINELMNTAMRSVMKGEIAEYELDTGQTRIRKKYNSPAMVQNSIKEYEALRQMYVNKLNKSTGSYRLMDERNFKR